MCTDGGRVMGYWCGESKRVAMITGWSYAYGYLLCTGRSGGMVAPEHVVDCRHGLESNMVSEPGYVEALTQLGW
jgi:hypothetical protein